MKTEYIGQFRYKDGSVWINCVSGAELSEVRRLVAERLKPSKDNSIGAIRIIERTEKVIEEVK